MLLNKVLRQVVGIAQPIVKQLEIQVRAWTKPTTDSLVGGMATDLVKSKEQLIMENALLRHGRVILCKPTTWSSVPSFCSSSSNTAHSELCMLG